MKYYFFLKLLYLILNIFFKIKFIDFGIPMEEFHDILNAGEHPDEWNTSEPEWDAQSNEIIISYEEHVELEEASEVVF